MELENQNQLNVIFWSSLGSHPASLTKEGRCLNKQLQLISQMIPFCLMNKWFLCLIPYYLLFFCQWYCPTKNFFQPSALKDWQKNQRQSLGVHLSRYPEERSLQTLYPLAQLPNSTPSLVMKVLDNLERTKLLCFIFCQCQELTGFFIWKSWLTLLNRIHTYYYL